MRNWHLLNVSRNGLAVNLTNHNPGVFFRRFEKKLKPKKNSNSTIFAKKLKAIYQKNSITGKVRIQFFLTLKISIDFKEQVNSIHGVSHWSSQKCVWSRNFSNNSLKFLWYSTQENCAKTLAFSQANSQVRKKNSRIFEKTQLFWKKTQAFSKKLKKKPKKLNVR